MPSRPPDADAPGPERRSLAGLMIDDAAATLSAMARKTTPPEFYAVWSTAWGPIGAVTGGDGLQRLLLPHYQMDQAADLLAWEHAGAVRATEPFAEIIELTRAYFNGQAPDFAGVICDLPGEGTFHGKVFRACRLVGHGQTSSYGHLARDIARPDAARAVATALGKNPLPLVVPCHRILYADGRLGGFSAPGGTDLKRRMLALESSAPTR